MPLGDVLARRLDRVNADRGLLRNPILRTVGTSRRGGSPTGDRPVSPTKWGGLPIPPHDGFVGIAPDFVGNQIRDRRSRLGEIADHQPKWGRPDLGLMPCKSNGDAAPVSGNGHPSVPSGQPQWSDPCRDPSRTVRPADPCSRHRRPRASTGQIASSLSSLTTCRTS